MAHHFPFIEPIYAVACHACNAATRQFDDPALFSMIEVAFAKICRHALAVRQRLPIDSPAVEAHGWHNELSYIGTVRMSNLVQAAGAPGSSELSSNAHTLWARR